MLKYRVLSGDGNYNLCPMPLGATEVAQTTSDTKNYLAPMGCEGDLLSQICHICHSTDLRTVLLIQG